MAECELSAIKEQQMSEIAPLHLEIVDLADLAEFRHVAKVYWQELMPHAGVVRDASQQEAYFQQRFTWRGGNCHPYWAVSAGRRVGFVSFSIEVARKMVCIEDFYVLPGARRQGVGRQTVQALVAYFDQRGIELIELNVRRDNPTALAFWEAQGFRIASYRLRQYRDPKTGTAYVGALSSDFVV
jgi:ribosomal protein S18 acetylase RimI-like enzyme